MKTYVIYLEREDKQSYHRFDRLKRVCKNFTEAYTEAYKRVEELLNEKGIYYEVIEIAKQ